MRGACLVLFLAGTSVFSSQAQVSDTPPFDGSDESQAVGQGLLRRGKVARFPNWEYRGDVLAEFRKKRGVVDPTTVQGMLSNPYHESGAALNYGDGLPVNFTGHLPVYTEGNWWPYIGPYQPQPPVGPHRDLTQDSGIYLQNGQPTATTEPTLVQGSDGATVVNKTPYGILITAGSYPGNEQPGQVMTPLAAGEQAPLPIPPKEWFLQGDGVTPRVPELYVSVAGLNPLDAPGWHYSSYDATYVGGGIETDYGTPGFAYLFSSLYDELGQGSGNYFLWGGFHKNEGYDPTVSGDPGYGVSLYIRDELVAVMDLYLVDGEHTAQQDMWALARYNPQVNAQGGLSAFPNAQEGTPMRYELIPHDEAQRLIREQGGPSLSKRFAGNANANVGDTTLPAPIVGNNGGNEGQLPPSDSPINQPPATQPPATQPPATQPPTTQPPTTQPPTTQPPTHSPPVAQPPVTTPPSNLPPMSHPPSLAFESNFHRGFTQAFERMSPAAPWRLRRRQTPSKGTGPDRSAVGKNYAYIETSAQSPAHREGTESVIQLARRYRLQQPRVNFKYHMLGRHIGTLSLQVQVDSNDWQTVWTKTGSQSDQWQQAEVGLNHRVASEQPFRLRWVATSKGGWQGDIALDDLQLWEMGSSGTETPSLPETPPQTQPPQTQPPIDAGITGQFTPSQGRLLFIGQDADSIDNYVRATDRIPAGVSGYTSLKNLEGLHTSARYGSGTQHLARLAQSYPNSALSVGLYLVDHLDDLNRGELDQNLDQLIDTLVAFNQPVFLRFGYEFDNPSFRYQAQAFQQAWRKTHRRIREKGAEKHIVMVWQSMTSCGQPSQSWKPWYPGDDVVDWIGVSTFTPQDCDYRAIQDMVDFARNKQKPIMIAEATPQGLDLSQSTQQAPQDRWGNNRQSLSDDELWSAWFSSWLAFINKNADVIRAATYINANWDEQRLWNPEQGSPFYWGDSRVQGNADILQRWLEEITQGDWLGSGAVTLP